MAKRKKIYQLPDAPLSPGDKGMHVDRLQEALDHVLKLRGKNRLRVREPGWYSIGTSTAVYRFRDEAGIRADFDFDKQAREKLREALHGTTDKNL